MHQNEQEQALKGSHLLGIVATLHAAEEIARSLRHAGYEATTLTEQEFANLVDPTGEKGGLLGHVFRLVEGHLSEESNILTQYQEAARQGKGILAARLEPDDARVLTADLTERGAYNLRLFTALSVIDLTPETNPQALARADGSNG
jgi:hypothetical protein